MGTNMAHASLTAQFRGVPASAGGGKAPEGEEHLGASALAGLITMFNNINAIRQHIQRDVVIRGVITRGGSRRETVPLLCEGWFSARGPDHRYLKEVLGKFENCARAAALATGTEVELTPGPLYAERLPNAPLSQDLRENMVRAGLDNVRSGAPAASSTDSGNVSQVVPLGAARVAIADPSVSGHSPGFAEAARTERAHAAMLAGAKSLAWTAVDLMARQDLFNAVREDFSTRTGHTLIGDAQALTLTR
jgi:metal-dependent amidase/aminoacylase/carboxypeptidase family protein